MKIGFDVSQTGRFKTGCGYFADALARALVARPRGHQFILYPTFGADYWDHEWRTSTLSMPDRPDVERGPGQARLDLLEAFWLDPPSDWEAQLGAPDIIHANNFYCPSRPTRARLVYTLHDLVFASHPDWTTEANWRVCFDGVFHASLYADHVVAVSDFTRTQFLELFPHFPAERISVVYEASRFGDPPSSAPPVRVSHLQPGAFWLAAGDLTPRKNLDRLLEAYATLRASGQTTHPLVLFGGQPVARDAANVERLGYVDDRTLHWLYAHCFAFCYPSLFEGFGLPVVEAMSQGAPILTSNLTSLPEVVGDGALMVDPTSTSAIAAGLQRLAADDALRRDLAHASQARASRFAWQTAAEQVLDIYEAAVTEYPRSGKRMPVGR